MLLAKRIQESLSVLSNRCLFSLLFHMCARGGALEMSARCHTRYTRIDARMRVAVVLCVCARVPFEYRRHCAIAT